MMYEKELTDKLLLLLTTLGKHGMEMGEVTKVTLHETKPFRLRNYLANNFFLRIKFEVDRLQLTRVLQQNCLIIGDYIHDSSKVGQIIF